jgi:hypothetical protein
MALSHSALPKVLLLAAGTALAGCAGEGADSIFTTGSLAPAATAPVAEPKVDPVCVNLVSRIETLRKEGIADKIEKAAAKRYKLTSSDLGKADQLTKASAELQLRCTTLTPASAQPAPAPAPVQKTSTRTDLAPGSGPQ